MQFTPEELKAISNLLQRVQIQGNEAMSVVQLQQKIVGLLKPKEDKKDGK